MSKRVSNKKGRQRKVSARSSKPLLSMKAAKKFRKEHKEATNPDNYDLGA